MTWQTKAMFTLQAFAITITTVVNILAVVVSTPAVKWLLASISVGVVIIDIIVVIFYGRYVNAR